MTAENEKILRKDEAIDCHGRKKRVKYDGYHSDRNHIVGDYCLQYDEDGVYHMENTKTKKIVETHFSSSWDSAKEYFASILIQHEKGVLK